MKKNGIINSEISNVLSYMRHTDTICISDLGLPCPENTEYIDISLKMIFLNCNFGILIK